MVAALRRGPGPAGLVLCLAVLTLAGTVVARPPHAPPLYDGIGFPDEPYRWVVPPQGEYRTPLAATEALLPMPVTGGVNIAGQAVSGEQGPQVALTAPRGTFAVPAGVSSITLQAVPQAVPGVQPDQGQVVSNLYVLSAEADGTAVSPAPGHSLLVTLRTVRPTAQAVVICRWTNRRWEQLPTTRVGRDIYAARLDTLGPVAVVRLDPGAASAGTAVGTSSAASSAGPEANLLWLALGVIVVVVAGALLLMRQRTARASTLATTTPAASTATSSGDDDAIDGEGNRPGSARS
jgi:hypothetical protein